MLVIDASVIVKAFVEEEGSAEASEVFFSENVLAAPAHALAEVGEVLCRKLKAGDLAAGQLSEILAALPGAVPTVQLDEILEQAVLTAEATGTSVYDCLYLVTAMRNACSFVTADQRLVRKLAGTTFGKSVTDLRTFRSAS
jgi:predicted nucleic acid-binding protein